MDAESSAAAAQIVASLATNSGATPGSLKLPGNETPAKQLLEVELRRLAKRIGKLEGQDSSYTTQNSPQTTGASNTSRPASVVSSETPSETDESSKEPDIQDGVNMASFFAQMSNEIRAPINAMLGMTQMVLDTELTGHQREMLKTAHDSASHLLSLVNDLLDICRIESKTLMVAKYPYRLGQTVLNALEPLVPRAEERLQTINFNVDQSVPDYVLGDSYRLRQATQGFLRKVIGLSERGQNISLSIERAIHPGKDGQMIEFIIESTESGEEWCSLDQYLDKVQNTNYFHTLGIIGGLGLYISTRLVRLMGGTLWTNREASQSQLHFTCQVELAPNDDESVKQGIESLRNRRVIIVNPEQSNFGAETMKLLQQAGAHAEMVDVDRLHSFMRQKAKTKMLFPWDTLLVDSVDTAKNIRALDGFKQNPIVALMNPPYQLSINSYAYPGVSSCMAASSDLESIGCAMVDALNSTTRSTPVDDPDMDPWRILLAEDNTINQKVVVKMLQKYKCAVTVAANGAEAVEMPVMGGVEAAITIREYEQSQRIRRTPIIGLLVNSMHHMDEWAEVSVDGYLVKPLSRNDMVKALQEAIIANTRPIPEILSRL